MKILVIIYKKEGIQSGFCNVVKSIESIAVSRGRVLLVSVLIGLKLIEMVYMGRNIQ